MISNGRGRATLERTLGLGTVVLIGLAYMTPLIVLGTYGVVAQLSNGTVPTAYLVTLVAMLFTALSYGRMASLYPVAGSAYTYVGREGTAARVPLGLAHPARLLLPADGGLAYRCGLPLGAVPWRPHGRVDPRLHPHNHRSERGRHQGRRPRQFSSDGAPASRARLLRRAVLRILPYRGHRRQPSEPVPEREHHACGHRGRGGPGRLLLHRVRRRHHADRGDARRRAHHPAGRADHRADLRRFVRRHRLRDAAGPSGRLLREPGLRGVRDRPRDRRQPVRLVLPRRPGRRPVRRGLAIQATSSRLLYAMGRDGVLPRPILGYLHPRFRTPVFGIFLIGVVGLAALFLDVTTSTSFINFGAFSAFTLVNVSVIAHFVRNRPQRGASALLVWVALPLAGAAVDFYLLTRLDIRAVVFGVVWLVIGVLLLTYLTRGFRQAPPQLSIDDGTEAAR